MLNNDIHDTPLSYLPSYWRTLPLRSVVTKTTLRDPRTRPNTPLKYIDVSSVSNDTYKIVEWKDIVGQDAPSRARKVVKARDTIFATVRPYLKNIAQATELLDVKFVQQVIV